MWAKDPILGWRAVQFRRRIRNPAGLCCWEGGSRVTRVEDYRAALESRETDLLQALANTTSVAMGHVRVYEELEQRVKDRTVQLEATNREMEAFSYAVSHDLRSPLTVVRGYSEILLSVLGGTAEQGVRRYLEQLVAGSKQMCEIIDDLLRFAMVAKTE